MSGHIEDHNLDLERIGGRIEIARASVDENTRLLHAREQTARASYTTYYWIIFVESVVLFLLLYIGL